MELNEENGLLHWLQDKHRYLQEMEIITLPKKKNTFDRKSNVKRHRFHQRCFFLRKDQNDYFIN